MNDPACIRCEPGMTCLGYCEEGKQMELDIVVEFMSEDRWKRGPGGHWFKYRAIRPGRPEEGFGQTERESILDLRSKA